jgi:hypothetical protein
MAPIHPVRPLLPSLPTSAVEGIHSETWAGCIIHHLPDRRSRTVSPRAWVMESI